MPARICITAIVLSAIGVAAVPQPQAPGPPQVSKAWRLAFTGEGGIWVANGDGTGAKLVIKNGEAPAWSPDRKRIAFARDGNVWVANADGSRQRQLTFRWKGSRPATERTNDQVGGRDMDMAWAPRSNHITFSHWEIVEARLAGDKGPARTMSCASIFEAPTSFSSQRQTRLVRCFDIFDDSAAYHFSNYSHPVWSQSGKRLAFVRNGDICTATCVGTQGQSPNWLRNHGDWDEWEWDVHRLAPVAQSDAATYRCSRENEGVTHLSWSPDEKSLAYSICRLGGSGCWEIHLLRLRRDKWQDLAVVANRTLATEGEDPCFSPDGSFVAYTAVNVPWNFFSGVVAVSLDGKTKVRLVKDACEPAW